MNTAITVYGTVITLAFTSIIYFFYFLYHLYHSTSNYVPSSIPTKPSTLCALYPIDITLAILQAVLVEFLGWGGPLHN